MTYLQLVHREIARRVLDHAIAYITSADRFQPDREMLTWAIMRAARAEVQS